MKYLVLLTRTEGVTAFAGLRVQLVNRKDCFVYFRAIKFLN